MALTTTQINQAYLAILGRGAVGTESNVGANASVSSVAASLITAAAKDNSEMFTTLADRVLAEGNGLDNDTFVESLYTTFLNRGSDEEGKAYWLSALNSGMSRKDLVASVIDAIVSQKAANSQDYQNYLAQVTTQADAFVESLYQNLLGREADAEGKAYWISLIADGASYADIAANAAAAALAQGKDTIDGATVANRLEVADYATTNLTSFSKLTTAADIEMIKENLKQTIANITSNAESVADYKTDIDSTANTYKAPGSVSFTKKEGEELGIDANTGKYNTTKATDFKGTINISNAANSTIHTSDKVTANPEFADGSILTVNVTGATKEQHTLNLTNQLPNAITGVKNLVINASNAIVSGDINGDTFTKTVTINAGYTSQTDKNASDITVKNNLEIYNAGAKADQLTVESGASIDTAKMGNGNDTIILKAGATPAIIANIDGGAGNDTLELTTSSTPASGDYSTIKSINSVEIIKLGGVRASGDTASISYDAIKGNNKKFTLAVADSTKAGSGDLTIKAGNNTDIDLSQITNGEKSGTSYNNKVASITLDGVTANANIKLNPLAKDQGGTAEKIVLAAADGTVKDVNITGFVKGTTGSAQDSIKIGTFAGTASATSKLEAVPAAGTGALKDKAYVKVQEDIVLDLAKAKTLVGKLDGDGSALVALSSGTDKKELSNIYLVTGTNSTITGVELIATVDADITTDWKMVAGVLSLA